jgi:hypothetical protein
MALDPQLGGLPLSLPASSWLCWLCCYWWCWCWVLMIELCIARWAWAHDCQCHNLGFSMQLGFAHSMWAILWGVFVHAMLCRPLEGGHYQSIPEAAATSPAAHKPAGQKGTRDWSHLSQWRQQQKPPLARASCHQPGRCDVCICLVLYSCVLHVFENILSSLFQ